jgi:hypothetical protein
MTSQDDYINIQRRLLDIYERGHLMDQLQFNQAIIELTRNAHIMVRSRRQENAPPVPPVAHIPIYPHHRHIGINRFGPFTQPIVQPIVLNGPYTAPLRPVVRKNPLEQYKTIKKADFEAHCTDSCSICLEIHTKGDSLTTECNHEFGKDCYNFWMNSLSSNKKCPTCRKDCPKVTYYKTRKTKPIPLIIEDNDSETEVSVF